jgi:vancomycin permeability regulator SanA
MKRKLLITVTFALLFFLTAIIALIWSGLTERLAKADIALVLGNKVNPDGTPSPRLNARLDKAASLFRSGYFPKIIVSGGTGLEGVPEGTAMKRYLVEKGVPETVIIVDDQGDDTEASARNIAVILKSRSLESVFVITQYFHVPRSRLALSKFGISPVYNAHPSYFEMRDIYSLVREVPAYVIYALRSSEAEPAQ